MARFKLSVGLEVKVENLVQELAMTHSLMRLLRRFVLTVAVACVAGLCTPALKAAPPPSACDLLSTAQVQQILGKLGQVQDAKPSSCLWFAPVRRTLSIRIDSAIISDPNKQLAMLRSLAQKMSPKHTFQDEPTVGPLAFSETTTIKEWLVKFVKGQKVVVIKVDDAPGGLEAARAAAKLLYEKM